MRETLPLWIFLLILYLVYLASNVKANPYDYQILRVIDGDTVEFEADFLPGALKQKLSLRVYGVDTPEKGPRAHCSDENLKSLNAKLFTEQEIKITQCQVVHRTRDYERNESSNLHQRLGQIWRKSYR